MEIKLVLSKNEILQRVKAKSHIKGVSDMNEKESVNSVRKTYTQQAGDDPDSDFLLLSSLRTGVDRFKSIMVDYVISFDDDTDTADNIHDNLSDTTVDVFTIFLNVSERFNKAMTQPLTDHASAYVENQMLYDWYLPLSPDVAKNFASAAAAVQIEIMRSVVKIRPKIPTYKYPTKIIMRYPVIPERDDIPGYITPENSGSIQPETLFANPWIMGIGQETEISYTLLSDEDGYAPLDDIVVRADNHDVCKIGFNQGKWSCKGSYVGYTVITLYSRHDDSVFAQFAVRIVK